MKIAKKESLGQKILRFKFVILLTFLVVGLCVGFLPMVSSEFDELAKENKTQQASIRKNKFRDGLPEGAYIIQDLDKDWYIVRFEEKEYLGKLVETYNHHHTVNLERMD